MFSNIKIFETKDRSLNIDSLKENTSLYSELSSSRSVRFCEACVFSLEWMKPPFQNKPSALNRRLLSSKRDSATNAQYAMFN